MSSNRVKNSATPRTEEIDDPFTYVSANREMEKFGNQITLDG